MATIQARLRKPNDRWVNWADALADLSEAAIATEEAGLSAKVGHIEPVDSQLLRTAAEICALARQGNVSEIVYVPGTRDGLAKDVPVLAQIAPIGNTGLKPVINGPKLTFTITTGHGKASRSPGRVEPRTVPPAVETSGIGTD
jgi:hypothetical protein